MTGAIIDRMVAKTFARHLSAPSHIEPEWIEARSSKAALCATMGAEARREQNGGHGLRRQKARRQMMGYMLGLLLQSTSDGF